MAIAAVRCVLKHGHHRAHTSYPDQCLRQDGLGLAHAARRRGRCARLAAAAGANSDVSWLLVVADHLADGHRDFIEFNPPGAIFTYLPAIWLARLTGLSAEVACDLVVAAVAAISLALASFALGRGFAARHNTPILATVAVAIFLVVPAYAFGQKEHFGAMLLLPWIAVVAARLDGAQLPLWLRICAGVAGGLCIVLKPHFALNIGVLAAISGSRTSALCDCCSARKISPLQP